MIDQPRTAYGAVEANRLQQLDKCVLFEALNEQERRDLAAHAQSRSFALNEPIFHVGDPESS